MIDILRAEPVTLIPLNDEGDFVAIPGMDTGKMTFEWVGQRGFTTNTR